MVLGEFVLKSRFYNTFLSESKVRVKSNSLMKGRHLPQQEKPKSSSKIQSLFDADEADEGTFGEAADDIFTASPPKVYIRLSFRLISGLYGSSFNSKKEFSV